MTTTMTGGAVDRIEQLGEHECWGRLLGSQVGRLAFEGRGRIEIVPLNYVVRGSTLVFTVDEGAELLAPQRGPVSFEVDSWDAREAWSVVAHGSIARDDDPGALTPEQEAGVTPWPRNDGASVVVRFTVRELTGRSFERSTPPELLWSW